MTDEERRRREQHRRVWLELAFDKMPNDVPEAVVRLWASGGTSTAVASRILDTDAAGLRDVAARVGIPVTRTDKRSK